MLLKIFSKQGFEAYKLFKAQCSARNRKRKPLTGELKVALELIGK